MPIIGAAGVSLSFAIGMVKFKGDLDAVRASIREMQGTVVADDYLKAIPSVAKTRLCTSGSCKRIDPPPISKPLSTRS